MIDTDVYAMNLLQTRLPVKDRWTDIEVTYNRTYPKNFWWGTDAESCYLSEFNRSEKYLDPSMVFESPGNKTACDGQMDRHQSIIQSFLSKEFW